MECLKIWLDCWVVEQTEELCSSILHSHKKDAPTMLGLFVPMFSFEIQLKFGLTK
jgi:hypothetical protein